MIFDPCRSDFSMEEKYDPATKKSFLHFKNKDKHKKQQMIADNVDNIAHMSTFDVNLV